MTYYYDDQLKRRQLVTIQPSFQRNCLWISLGFMILSVILTLNLWPQ